VSTRTTYYCDICNEEFDPDKHEGVGLALREKYKDHFRLTCESALGGDAHICFPCMKSLAVMWADLEKEPKCPMSF
jgi:hypothetical protein